MLSTATTCHRNAHRSSGTYSQEQNRPTPRNSFDHDNIINGQSWKDFRCPTTTVVISPRRKAISEWTTSPPSARSSSKAYFDSNAIDDDYDDEDDPCLSYQNAIEVPPRQRVTVNVSGEKYQTYTDTLDRFPNTLMGDPGRREMYYCCAENEYFFDRDRHAFNAILYFYQSGGQLYCPVTVPMNILVSEAKFFELGNDALKQVLDIDEGVPKALPKNKFQREVWKLFEYPDSSKAANILTLFSVAVIILSVAILCTETLPDFKRIRAVRPVRGTAPLRRADNGTVNGTVLPIEYSDGFLWQTFFDYCEVIFVAWFTFEFLVRFLSSPNKCDFLKSMMNLIDILSISPYYITTAVQLEGDGLANFRIFRLVRVFRIFKLSRHSRGLQILGLTLKASMRELGLLIFFLAIGVILFSSAVYYVEANAFSSIPDAFWWAIVTMCTVGYGDKVPHTFVGKLVGSACAVSGVLTIALPVPVIVSNFDYFYNRERTRKMHQDVVANTELDLDKAGDEGSLGTKSPASSTHKREPHDRGDLIQRQSELRKLESTHRKLSQRLSEMSSNKTKASSRATSPRTTSVTMPQNGNAQPLMERESCL